MTHAIHLALTFYGGVSLAVFQAGVAYELIRAVQFSRARGGDAERADGDVTPLPNLHVDVVTGTSSGGMAAIQLALGLAGRDPEAVLARMAHTWIDGADFSYLIPKQDCTEQGLLSLAKSRELMGALLAAANPPDRDRDKRLEDDLDCYLTLTNLSGLREPVVLSEPGRTLRQCTFPTTRHCEYEQITAADLTADGVGDPDAARHRDLVDTVLATAGFPVAFEPITRHSSAIDEGAGEKGKRANFAYIDGGVVDNQPLTVALDALAERPAEDRRLYFVDPSVKWASAEFGEDKPGRDVLDPLSVYLRVSDVARTDSIHEDLERVRRLREDLDVLRELREKVFHDKQFRDDLGSVFPTIAERYLNPGAWTLWTLIRGGHDADAPLVGAKVQAAWRRVADQERFALRARLDEYLHLWAPADRAEPVQEARAHICKPEVWRNYYTVLGRLRRLDRRFRHLRYRVWKEHLGQDLPGEIPDELQAAIAGAFDALVAEAEALTAERRAILDAVAAELYGAGLGCMLERSDWREDFLEYARAMQVLESLAGVGLNGELRVRRITPFDIYADGAKRAKLRPLAGGALGAFAGFLHGDWRANDFLVGRLVMRRWLADEGLIPAHWQGRYRDWCAERDTALLARLPDGSVEHRTLCGFHEHRPPPYRDDNDKPKCLLRPDEMDVGRLPGRHIISNSRRLLGSLARVRRRNQDKVPYRVLGALTPVMLAAGGLSQVTAQTLRLVPSTDGDTANAIGRRVRQVAFIVGIGLLGGMLALGYWIGRHARFSLS